MGGIIYETLRELAKRKHGYKNKCKENEIVNIDCFLSEEFEKEVDK